MPKFTWLTDKILEIRFASSYELCDATYLFSHHYEDPEWNGKIFTRLELDEYYENKYADANWWKKRWAGSNLPDNVFRPFIEGQFIGLTDFENNLIQVVRGKSAPYYVVMTSESALYCRDHEIAHALWYTNKEYRDEAERILYAWKMFDTGLADPIAQLRKAGYSDKVMDDELHVFCGIYYHHYFKQLNINVPMGMRDSLVALFQKHKL